MNTNILNLEKIFNILERAKNPYREDIFQVLEKAKEKNGLTLEEAAVLLYANDSGLRDELFKAASQVKDEIYGERIVFFAPLYVSDYCRNNCAYCNFHSENKALKLERLSLDEIGRKAEFLIAMGHKRLLLEFGEDRR